MDSSFIYFLVIVIATICVSALLILTVKVHWNRQHLVALEAKLELPIYQQPPARRRGLVLVLLDQWWAYGPMLILALLAYLNNGPGFEMWLLIGSAIFWIGTGSAEDMNSN